MKRRLRPAHVALIVVVPVLSACAAVPRQEPHGQMAQTVSRRLSVEIDWEAGTPQEAAVREQVRRLLQGELTAEKAVAIALVNNWEIRALLAKADVALADLVQAGLLDNPAFGLELRYGGGTRSSEYSLFSELMNLFTLSARRTLAGGDLERVRLEVAQGVLDLAALVKRDYFALLSDQQVLMLRGQILDATEAAAELASRQYTAGTLNLRDQAMQQSFFARAALETAAAQARLASDREAFGRLLGLWTGGIEWRLPPGLPELPDHLPLLGDLERRALTERLDLAARRVEVETAHAALGYARQTRWLSVLGLGVTLERDRDEPDKIGPDLEISLPLFDRGQGRISRLEAQLAEAESRYAQLAIEVRSRIREASGRLASAHAEAVHYREAILPLAQRVVDETLKHYNGMLLGVYDLLEAKKAQIDATREATVASRDFWIAWGDLERAVGKTLSMSTGDVEPALEPEPEPPGQEG